MQKLHFPHVILPAEFVGLLKKDLPPTAGSAAIFENIKSFGALYTVLQKAFQEFDDGRGLEKTMVALGWENFRDRMASVYVYKSLFGDYPHHTSMEIVEGIKQLETRFLPYTVHGSSRLFLLGFYFHLGNIQIQRRENNKFLEIKVPFEVDACVRLTQGKSEKIDWLILILMHLLQSFGEKILMGHILSGKKFTEIYPLMSDDDRKIMLNNLLAYGASIGEQDIFLYDKV